MKNPKDRLVIIILEVSTLLFWAMGWLFMGALIATWNITSWWWWLGVAIMIIAFFNSERYWHKRTAIKKKRADKSYKGTS